MSEFSWQDRMRPMFLQRTLLVHYISSKHLENINLFGNMHITTNESVIFINTSQ